MIVHFQWAKSLNVFRRKHSKQVRPEDLLNETGAPDLVISKVPVSPKPPVVVSRAHLTYGLMKGLSRLI